MFAELARVLRPGGIPAGVDSLDGEAFRELHVDDICVPIEAATLPDRLRDAGFTGVDVDTDDRRLRFSARVAGFGAARPG